MKKRYLILLSLFLLGLPSVASAEDSDSGIEESGPVVRRILLYRSTRLEIAPQMLMTVNDPFRMNMGFGLAVNYHLTNDISIGGSFSYAALHFNTELTDNMEAVLKQDKLNQITIAQNAFSADAGFFYAPMFGKFSLFKSTTTNYDLHIGAGFSLVSEEVYLPGKNLVKDKALEGIRPGGFASLGTRFFLSDMFSVNLDWKNRFYNRAVISTGKASTEFSWVPEVTIGIGIFLPGSVKISR